jgi:hypothetical protein
MGSEVVHSYYTPTLSFKYFEVVARALKISSPTIRPYHLLEDGYSICTYFLFRDVASLCIVRSYTLYSYLTWSTVYLIGSHDFILSRAWVCLPW